MSTGFRPHVSYLLARYIFLPRTFRDPDRCVSGLGFILHIHANLFPDFYFIVPIHLLQFLTLVNLAGRFPGMGTWVSKFLIRVSAVSRGEKPLDSETKYQDQINLLSGVY
jgi:hypothetical protein